MVIFNPKGNSKGFLMIWFASQDLHRFRFSIRMEIPMFFNDFMFWRPSKCQKSKKLQWFCNDFALPGGLTGPVGKSLPVHTSPAKSKVLHREGPIKDIPGLVPRATKVTYIMLTALHCSLKPKCTLARDYHRGAPLNPPATPHIPMLTPTRFSRRSWRWGWR